MMLFSGKMIRATIIGGVAFAIGLALGFWVAQRH